MTLQPESDPPANAEAARWFAQAQARAQARDADGARRLLEQAAQAGHLPAQMQLGAWDLIGLGGPVDLTAAVARLRDAAERGHAPAMTLHAQVKGFDAT